MSMSKYLPPGRCSFWRFLEPSGQTQSLCRFNDYLFTYNVEPPIPDLACLLFCFHFNFSGNFDGTGA